MKYIPGTAESCFKANVFGAWHSAPDPKKIYLTWDTFRGDKHLLKRLVMKIRPVGFQPSGEGG